MSTKPKPQEPGIPIRISFIDVMRGVAVVSMIWMHTADGWLDRSYRQSEWWPRIASFGGWAAPLFFLLAGTGMGLAWQGASAEKLMLRLASQWRRGLQLVVLGYALRLQMWMIDAGGYRRWTHWIAACALGAAYVLAYRALNPGSARSASVRRFLGAAALMGGAIWLVSGTEPKRLVGLLRVDVLQGIGLSMCVLAVLCTRWPTLAGRPAWLVLGGVAVAAATGGMRAALPGPIPVPLAGYIAAWPVPTGTPSTTLFPLLPWMSYVFVGAAAACVWTRANAAGQGQRAIKRASLLGVALIFGVAEWQPWVHDAVQRWPDALHVVRVVYRVAVAMTLATPAWWIADTAAGRTLRVMGTTSMWIYWLHLEFAFGVLAWPLKHRLHLGGWLVGFVMLTLAMWGVARAIDAQVGVARLRSLLSTRA